MATPPILLEDDSTILLEDGTDLLLEGPEITTGIDWMGQTIVSGMGKDYMIASGTTGVSTGS